MEELTALEANWGGDVNTRMARKAAAWRAASQSNAAAKAGAQGSVEDAEVRQSSEGTPQPATPINRDAAATPEPETANGPASTNAVPSPDAGPRRAERRPDAEARP
jgi:hypothetical protein